LPAYSQIGPPNVTCSELHRRTASRSGETGRTQAGCPPRSLQQYCSKPKQPRCELGRQIRSRVPPRQRIWLQSSDRLGRQGPEPGAKFRDPRIVVRMPCTHNDSGRTHLAAFLRHLAKHFHTRWHRHTQKYPAFLRSSMAVSLRRSSARVPRSVWRAAATSAMTSSSVDAVDSTAPVQVASPTVRKRTRRV